MRVSQFLAAVSASVLGLAALASSANAVLTAGDLAIIGRTNNTTIDTFTFTLLTNVAAGEEVYFTDNGWTGTAFRNTVADGDGNENLLKFTAVNALAAGSVIRNNTTSANYTFTVTGVVPGNTTGSFANLALATGGDQIYAFQGPTNQPLQNPSNFVFVFDDTNGFENATDTATGNIPTGLVLGSTANTFNSAVGGSYGLDTASANFTTFNATPRTKSEFLTYIANPANYTTASEPSSAISFNVAGAVAVPEANTFGLLALALPVIGGVIARRRK